MTGHGCINVLLETPSGFALFSVGDKILKEVDDIWVHFRDADAAKCIMYMLGFVKFDDKSDAWEGKTRASEDLKKLIEQFCKNENEPFVHNVDPQVNFTQMGIQCSCDDHNIVEELIWGVKNVVDEFVPEENNTITMDYCLPLSKGLQKFLQHYCINLSPVMVNKDFISKLGLLRHLDMSLEEVPKVLRESFDKYVSDIGKIIEDDLKYAKVLSNILVPELALQYNFSEMFPPETASLILEAQTSAKQYRERKLSLNDRGVIMGALSHLLSVPEYRDKVLTFVKRMEAKIRRESMEDA